MILADATRTLTDNAKGGKIQTELRGEFDFHIERSIPS
jgi:hypothetical protein